MGSKKSKKSMTNAVIGAQGDMGKNLLVPLLQKLGSVVEVSRSSSAQDWDNAWKADVIWLSIPRDKIPQILQGVKLRADQLVIDICSIKRRLSETVKQTGAAHLSLHPLQGPYVPLNGQKWVIVPTDKRATDHPRAKSILAFLREQEISFIEAKSEDEHDFMLGITLSIPEFLTILLDSLVDQYSEDCGRKKPSMEKIMEWSVPASNAFFSAYVHSVNSSANWLREDLICGAYGNLINSSKKSFAKLCKFSVRNLKEEIIKQNKFVNNLPLEERKRVRQWIERWFVDATQKIFSFHRKKQMKPRITIQHHEEVKEIFPIEKGRVSVGIHGIEGCFTYESALRLCEELKIDSKKLDFKYLIEAKKVMEMVVEGKIDRGVFCIANSGSGAYVESAYAISQYQFDILAIYGMEILQCLLAHSSIKSISQIKEVFGHPQAISQCKRTFAEKYPQIKLVPGKDSDDTALCAKRISEGKFPKTTATLASQTAAELYGLNILEYGMHHDPFNTTTFLVIKKRNR